MPLRAHRPPPPPVRTGWRHALVWRAALAAGAALGSRAATAAPGGRAAWPITPDLTVAADGSGDCRTVQAALDTIPAGNRERRIIFIKDGVYHEKIRLDAADVTLLGQSRTGTRIEFAQGAEEFRRHPDARGIGVVNINGDDCVIENLTVQNTQGVIGVHAFAIYGTGDRTVLTDDDVLSQGNDTLSLWKRGGGRYYHARLHLTGSVDFVCPRGWCYLTDCTLDEENPNAGAMIWHDGSTNRDMKFVLRNCRFDGVDGWRLARHHHDAQFYLLDCTFSGKMLDVPPHRVVYPLGGRPATDADRKRNRELDATNVWGERAYYYDCHRDGGDFAWFRDNLAAAPGAPQPAQITAAWTFGGTWDPESTVGPVIRRVERQGAEVAITFSESVTVKGRPELRLASGAAAVYAGGSGTAVLTFAAPPGPPAAVDAVVLDRGARIIATGASAALRVADLSLPQPPPSP
jgi:pectinesterase